jgi:hypothetical protein
MKRWPAETVRSMFRYGKRAADAFSGMGLEQVELEEIVGVDIDRDPDIALEFWNGSSPGPEIALQVGVAGGLDEQAPAMPPADNGDRGFCRS